MNEISIEQIDYRFLLVDYYKSLGLNEYDLAILLLVDNILTKENILITPDLLALKMNLSVKEIDTLLASLSSRGFIEYVSINNTLVTSLNPLYNKIIKLFKEDILKMHEDNSNKEIRDELSNVYLLIQKELERFMDYNSLTLAELREIARSKQLKNVAAIKKAELVELLTQLNEKEAEDFARLCTSLKLSLIHLRDVVEDILG